MSDYGYVEPPKFRKIRKKLWNGKEWVDMIFYEIPINHAHITWFYKAYGPPIYQGDWWMTVNQVAMTEKVYLHWSLANE